MEADFDKEIDALLRKEAAGRTITISEFRGGLHLDADEIAAFAEKRVPPGVRMAFVKHFADCDRCRKILLNAAWLNAEETAAEAAVAAPAAETAVPWHRRLFAFPKLAYVLGGLVVLFAGFIGLSVLTRTYMTGGSELSKAQNVSQISPEAAPTAAPAANTSAAANAANTAATSSNAASNVPFGVSSIPSGNAAGESPVSRQQGVPVDEGVLKDAQPSAAAPPPPPPAAEDVPAQTRKARELRAAPAESERDRKSDEQADVTVAQPAPKIAPGVKPKEPVRSDDQAFVLDGVEKKARKEEQKAARKNEALSAASGAGNAATSRKYVNGRTFELKQGVWYDTAYRGQGTINVRRGTTDYQKLDSQLRSIAESFTGTVVVTVWNGQAYRIQ
jgi:hypothetical protein